MDYTGFKFGKGKPGKQKKKREKCKKVEIPGNRKNYCYICGRYGNMERHHIFEGTANRKCSDKYKIIVYLCPECHREGKTAVHKNQEALRALKRIGQRAFEEQEGDRKKFIKVFGKNYLEDIDD